VGIKYLDSNNTLLSKNIYSFTLGGLKLFSNIFPSSTSLTLGTSSAKWNNVYSSTFTGDLDGNAGSTTKLNTAKNLWG
jgi:hypothetical protein